MKVLTGRRVEGHVRLLGRIVRVVFVAAAMLAGSAQPASAQFIEFMEWLDRLSGPGPFDLNPIYAPSVSIPIGCVTRVTTKQNDTTQKAEQVVTIDYIRQKFGEVPTSLRALSTAQTTALGELRKLTDDTQYRLELAPGCFGVVAAANSANPSIAPWGSLDGRPDGRAILEKRQVFMFELNIAHLASRENELEGYSATLTDDDKEVKLFRYGLGIRYLAHPSTFIRVSWERNHFYSSSDLFPSFDRDTRSIEVGSKPLWASRYRLLQPFTVSAGVKSGLGRFTSADFGARGAYRADDEVKPVFKIGYDIWVAGCWAFICG